MQNKRRKLWIQSFRGQLILALCIISAIPLLVIQAYSYYRTTELIQESTNELIETNMGSMLQSVTLTIDGYRSILDQLYVDDTLVALVNRLNAGDEKALNTNQLIRLLRTACYAKEYVQGITVVLADGSMVFYDKLTGSTIRNAWMEQDGVAPLKLFEAYTKDNLAHLLPSGFAAEINHERIYLFHIARRVIDYRNIDKQLGVVVLSLDERILRETINGETGGVGQNFLLDGQNGMLSAPGSIHIGRILSSPLEECVQLATGESKNGSRNVKPYELADAALGWRLISVVDQSQILGRIEQQQQMLLGLLLLVLIFLALAIFWTTRRLGGSIRRVAAAMRRAGAGDMHARVTDDQRMPTEMTVIADQFNLMMEDIDQLIGQVKLASEKQRDAEIAMLEAQINPHFLYNTLDSINWMAIDENQMEISGAIAALARILRYSIDDSNRIVPLRDEVDWLERYLYLQQVRLKHGFTYELNVSVDVMALSIHKLLFQPFVENAIRHGFEGKKDDRKLTITIQQEEGTLLIRIEDNGQGIEPGHLAEIRQAIAHREEQPGHIGILNAVSRMRMYYGEAIDIQIDSVQGEGTKVVLRIPLGEEGKNV